MTLDEARAWCDGLRSSINNHMALCGGDNSLASVRAAQEDAATMECAYWILRAHHEKLTGGAS